MIYVCGYFISIPIKYLKSYAFSRALCIDLIMPAISRDNGSGSVARSSDPDSALPRGLFGYIRLQKKGPHFFAFYAIFGLQFFKKIGKKIEFFKIFYEKSSNFPAKARIRLIRPTKAKLCSNSAAFGDKV